MQHYKKILLSSFGGALFGFLGEMGGMPAAIAACTPGAQCKMTDGGMVNLHDATFSTKTDDRPNAALVSTHASTINGKNLTITTPKNTYRHGYYAAHAVSGGAINLENSHIDANYGLEVEGKDSLITMRGGTIDTSKDAVRLRNGAAAVLEHVDIKTGASYGLSTFGFGENNSLTIIGGSISHHHDTSANNGTGGAVNAGSGHTLIDGTKITSNGKGVMVSSQLKGQGHLEMKGGFSIETSYRNGHGIDVNNYSVAKIEKGHIHTKGQTAHGILVIGRESQLEASDVTIVTEGATAHGVMAFSGESQLDNVDITVNSAYGIYADGSNKITTTTDITMTDGSVTVKGNGGSAALAAMGSLDLDRVTLATTANRNIGLHLVMESIGSFTNGIIETSGASSQGIFVYGGSKATIANSIINVRGDKSYGAYVGSNASAMISNSQINVSGTDSMGLVIIGATAPNQVTFDNSTLEVKDSVAIVANGGTDRIDVRRGSRIEGDRLVFAGNYDPNNGQIYGSVVDVNASDSELFGRANVTAQSRLSMNLDAGSVWILRPAGADQTQSDVSSLTLADSNIVFDHNKTGFYQTLIVGSGKLDGKSDVYKASGNASISFNTFLNEGGALDQQQTDRLVINGDVSGITSVTINAVGGSSGGVTSPGDSWLHDEGISIIQVAGKAASNSFQLKGGYIALDGKPYQYVLNAYGPGSDKGAADEKQRLVNGDMPHWDFRLQSKLTTTGNGDGVFWEVTPQVASYLVAPIALFQAQSMDIGSLHRRLGSLRDKLTDDAAARASEGRGEFFLRAYGGDFEYQSNLSTAQYGYDANIRYKAMQAGGNLYGFDGKNSLTRFGLAGSYGDLTFKPYEVEGAHATHMEVGRLTPYITWQHDSGAYFDMVVSYGHFDGFVSTSSRGNTVRLKGDSMAAAFEAGMPFLLSASHSLTLEPQAQLTWQKLAFDRKRDIDGFAVALGNPERWSARVGFKWQQHFIGSDGGGSAKPYATLHLAHAFKDENRVWLGQDFELGRVGTHLEIGAGIEANWRQKFHLYGDVNWQKNLVSYGISGLQFNAGLRGNL